MPDPITLEDGSVIEDFDTRSITVRSPGGRTTRMARSLAPDRFQAAVGDRENQAQQPPVQFQSSGPVLDLQAIGDRQAQQPAASPVGRQVFDESGRRLDQAVEPAAPAPGPAQPVGLGGGMVLEQESPEEFQRRRGEVRAPARDGVLFQGQGAGQERTTFRQPTQPQVARATGGGFGTRRTTTTTASSTRLTPEQQQALQGSQARAGEATGRIQESFRAEGVDRALAGQERRDLLEERGQLEQQFGQRSADVTAVNQQRERELFDQQEVLRQEIENEEIDSGRLWRNKSTGKKIALAIGGFLSGFVRRGKGEDPILRQIEGEIDRDIEQQRDAFGSRRVALNKLTNLYAQARQKGLDDLAAVEVAKGAAMAHVESRLRELGERTQDQAQQAALFRKADEFSLRREESLQKSVLAGAQKIETKVEKKRVPTRGVGAAGVDTKGRPVAFPGLVSTGERASPLREKEVNELSKAVGALSDMMASIETLERLRARHGTEFFEGGVSAQANLATEDIKSAIQKAKGGGVMTDADERRLNKIVPTISDFSARQLIGQDPTLEKIRGMRSQFLAKFRSGLRRRYGMDLAPNARGLQSRSEGVAR